VLNFPFLVAKAIFFSQRMLRKALVSQTLQWSHVECGAACAMDMIHLSLHIDRRHSSSSFKVGTVLDWKLFKGYGFIQETVSGAHHFCPRKAINGALFLRPGDPVRFEVEATPTGSSNDIHDTNLRGLARCKSVTDVNGEAFEQQELQGIVMDVPVPSKGVVGLICRVGKWSPSMSATTSPSPPAAPTAAPEGGGLLYHYSFAHSKALSVGDMVRFWSRENPQRRTAKDVVAVDQSILSPDELRLLQTTRRLVSQQTTRSVASNVKFQHQQWQPLTATGDAHHESNPPPAGGVASGDNHLSSVAAEEGSSQRMHPCVVAHFQGRYGKLRVIGDDGNPLIVFFHADMANRKPNKIISGLKGTCSYDRVRQGKNAGTLRAHRVIFPI
jgi:cold shock CspA family protein